MHQEAKSKQSSIEALHSQILVPRRKVQLLGLLALSSLLIYGGFSLAGGSSLLRSGSSFKSQGLGITRLEFERLHNLPTMVIPDPRWTSELSYERDGYYHIYFWYNGPGAQSFEESLIKGISLNMPQNDRAQILTEVHKFLPTDSVLKESKEKTSDGTGHQKLIIDTYESKSLAKRYPPLPSIPDPWKDHTQGTILVITSPEGGAASIYADLTSVGKVEPPQPTRRHTKTPSNSLTPAPPPMPVHTVPMPEPSMPLPVPSPKR